MTTLTLKMLSPYYLTTMSRGLHVVRVASHVVRVALHVVRAASHVIRVVSHVARVVSQAKLIITAKRSDVYKAFYVVLQSLDKSCLALVFANLANFSYSQLASRLLTTCSRLAIVKPVQATPIHSDISFMTARKTRLQQTRCKLCVSVYEGRKVR